MSCNLFEFSTRLSWGNKKLKNCDLFSRTKFRIHVELLRRCLQFPDWSETVCWCSGSKLTHRYDEKDKTQVLNFSSSLGIYCDTNPFSLRSGFGIKSVFCVTADYWLEEGICIDSRNSMWYPIQCESKGNLKLLSIADNARICRKATLFHAP